MSSQWEHVRRDGHLAAMKELHQRVAADLDAKRGDIKPARTLYADYDAKKLLMRTLALVWKRA